MLLKRIGITFVLLLIISPPLFCQEGSKVRDDYQYTPEVKMLAEKGYELFRQGQYANSHNGGYYTDPVPMSGSLEFWSDGRKANLDREGTGHHETIFVINDGKLIYVGSIGSKGRYVDVGKGYENYLGKYSNEPFNPSPKSDEAKVDQGANPQSAKGLHTEISIDFRTMPAADVLKFLGSESGYDIKVNNDFQGKINILALDIPIQEALDALVFTHQLYYEIEEKNVIFHQRSEDEGKYERLKKKLEAETDENGIGSLSALKKDSHGIADKEIGDILKYICGEGGWNIIFNPDTITGRADLFLEDATAKEALEKLAETYGLSILRKGNLIIPIEYKGKHYDDGVHELHDNKGVLREIVSYKGGKRQGVTKIFSKDAQPLKKLEYNQDSIVREIVYGEQGRMLSEKNIKEGKNHGAMKIFNQDGQMLEESVYDQGLLIKKTTYDEQGKVVFSADVEEYRKNQLKAAADKGETIQRIGGGDAYLLTEIPEREYIVVNGEENGKLQVYWPNGLLKEEGNFKDGKTHGTFKYYTESGMLYREKNYVDGREHGVFREYWDNGQLESEVNVVNGKRHGISKFYLGNGRLRSEAYFIEDKKYGIFKFYMNDGRRQEVQYSDDKPIELKVYDEQGHIVSIEPVSDGEFSPFEGYRNLPRPQRLDMTEIKKKVEELRKRAAFSLDSRSDLTDKEIAILQSDAARLVISLNFYHSDIRYYPTTQQGLRVLKEKPTQEPALSKWRGPYIMRDPVDPWGNPYVYTYPGIHNKYLFDLSSYGPDGKESDDDINNWGDQ